MLTTTAPYRTGETTVTTDGGIGINAAGMQRRLRALLPPEWFADEAPVLDGVLAGFSTVLAFVAGLVVYAKRQTRIATATGGFLDVAALDFLGLRLKRRTAEPDAAFQLRIRREVMRPRVTRDALRDGVADLTGYVPDVFEPWNPTDCGGVGYAFALAGGETTPARIGGWGSPLGGVGVGGFAFVVPTPTPFGSPGAGRIGSLDLPNQIFLTIRRDPDVITGVDGAGGLGTAGRLGGGVDGAAIVSGFGGPLGGIGQGPGFAFLVPDGPTHAVTGVGAFVPGGGASAVDAAIYQRITETKAAGVTAWAAIRAQPRA